MIQPKESTLKISSCYISIINSYSESMDLKILKSTASNKIMKDWFSTHGTAELVEYANGP